MIDNNNATTISLKSKGGKKEVELTIKETATALEKTERTVWRLIKSGELETIRRGNKLFINAETIKKLGGDIEKAKQDAYPVKANRFRTLSEIQVIIAPKAKELSFSVTRELEQAGVITERLDQKAIEQFCYYSTLRDYLLKEAAKQDFTEVTPQRLSTIHRYAEFALKCEKIIIAYSDRLGLNPRARGQMKLKEQEEVDDDSGVMKWIIKR
ncbi:MAG: helix-turn-helix domain-containing protein [Campylobacteraceae bacterium]|jgi:phage terminase small subunit/DNA-binding CsgD family transcriptional regulator|nr:helix-turn-helix domain-containing protein [Campylobacteraceae bacterium]